MMTRNQTVITLLFLNYLKWQNRYLLYRDYNRKALHGAGLSQTGNMHIDYVFDGYENDSIAFPNDASSLYLLHIDDYLVQCADSVIPKSATDLSWIYLEYTDDVGHSKGTGAAFDSAVGLLDKQIKKISDAIQYREANFNEQWLLLIATDHGRVR